MVGFFTSMPPTQTLGLRQVARHSISGSRRHDGYADALVSNPLFTLPQPRPHRTFSIPFENQCRGTEIHMCRFGRKIASKQQTSRLGHRGCMPGRCHGRLFPEFQDRDKVYCKRCGRRNTHNENMPQDLTNHSRKHILAAATGLDFF
jgi:hypothetical protein